MGYYSLIPVNILNSGHTLSYQKLTQKDVIQHARNPVDWYPWGKEVFQKAIEEDKPILLSCGYSACHW